MNIDDMVQKYIQLRDKKSQYKAEYDLKVSTIDGLLGQVEGRILAHMQVEGSESIRTAHGTAYKTNRSSASVADWDVFWKHVVETDNPQLLERRVAKKAAEEYKVETGALPPGINWSEETVVNVRR